MDYVEAVNALTGSCGHALADPTDEHERWELYQHALERSSTRDRLLECLRVEPDRDVATSVVLRAMEQVGAGERMAWVEALPNDWRSFAEQRMRELAILEDPESARAEADGWQTEGWSNWLQLRTAERSEHLALLKYLADHGRTRRIRNIARERGRKLA